MDLYTLAPGIRLSFNEIYTGSWEKGDSSVFGQRMLILNFCVRGRCEASLGPNRYAIVKEDQVCVSTVLPTRDFYYPGRLYEGIQLYLDRDILDGEGGRDFLSALGVPPEPIAALFCGKDRRSISSAPWWQADASKCHRSSARPHALRYTK